MDMVAALDWVHSEVAAFGGDPGRITVGRESARSAGSLDMMWSPLAKGNAAGIISESGALGPRDPLTVTAATSYRTRVAAESFGLNFANQRNVSSITEMRELPVSVLMAEDNISDTILDKSICANVSGFGNPPEWRPVLDGYILPMSYEKALLSNSHWDIPVLTRNNKDEDAASKNPSLTLAEFKIQFKLMLDSLSEEFSNLYPADNDTMAGEVANTLWHDMTRVGMWQWAMYWQEGRARNSVFTYFWTHAPPNQTSGAYHGSELYYVFNNIPYTEPPKTWTANEHRIGDTTVSYWMNFIKTGNPNGHSLERWSANSDRKQIMVLGDSCAEGAISGGARVDFLERFFKAQKPW
ncbi:unnamed protein product [Penicillium nalgiovense]|uniref:Carboxylesterase type B domain-containing protein n=1 Tax=Penicillium nalgiovense TaxID=60175 RepID=A0A1V6W6A9_PENNA|nr:hypothetical protein PENNAL_c0374G03786 [Penicillium nalgiovense]CAG8071607.1 unnamed protein product [Penicillium nalgiovense]